MKQSKSARIGSRQMTRRDVLRLGVTAAAGAAVGPFVITPARAQSFNWQRFKGKEIFLCCTSIPGWSEIVKNAPGVRDADRDQGEVRDPAGDPGRARSHGGD